ncbi:hypothetical protein [Opitutus sp. ER46]|uniref:hypothetical protein n=1 Tax=Opitutus sp. ER46 TaxID=2161864 RepID=UPI000D31D866|nr:hypothetical protein [Opitutus sp. ER46]PTX98517.1 hypothetical protein DB354_04435 [Opitutus sp. ER46]
MKLRILTASLLALVVTATVSAQLKKLAISDVKAGSGLVQAAARNNTGLGLERIVQGFDSQLIDRMHNTRKFQIIARSDLKQLDKDDAAGQQGFKVPSADYVLVTTLDDFQDYQESMTLPSTGEKLTKRIIRVTAVAKIYDAAKGTLLETANVTLAIPDAGAQFNSQRNGDLSDALLQKVVTAIADATANRVTDVIFPAKIITRTDKQVTINRGDGTAIAVGQVWEVFALGKELRDPDTGEVLERERLNVGKIRITRVNPKTSLAEVIEDNGVTDGAIVQPVAAK